MRDFNHTISVLVKAYLNNTLQHENCYACAVGNIIADANRIPFCNVPRSKVEFDFHTVGWTGYENIYVSNVSSSKLPWMWPNAFYNGVVFGDAPNAAIDLIAKTGYSSHELAIIEYAFEHSYPGSTRDEHLFNGLMACVDQLALIHNIDLTAKEEAKKLFVKAV